MKENASKIDLLVADVIAADRAFDRTKDRQAKERDALLNQHAADLALFEERRKKAVESLRIFSLLEYWSAGQEKIIDDVLFLKYSNTCGCGWAEGRDFDPKLFLEDLHKFLLMRGVRKVIVCEIQERLELVALDNYRGRGHCQQAPFALGLLEWSTNPWKD